MRRLMLRPMHITITITITGTGTGTTMDMAMQRIPIMHTTTAMTNTTPMRIHVRPAALMTMITGRTLIRRTITRITTSITKNRPTRTLPRKRFPPR